MSKKSTKPTAVTPLPINTDVRALKPMRRAADRVAARMMVAAAFPRADGIDRLDYLEAIDAVADVDPDYRVLQARIDELSRTLAPPAANAWHTVLTDLVSLHQHAAYVLGLAVGQRLAGGAR
jgi:hypothetical protein